MVAALPTPNTSESGRPDDLRVKLLLKAIQTGDAAEVEIVLSGDVDVNATTSRGTTPLMSAVTYGHLEIVRVLLKRGAEPNQKRSDGFTALALAAFFGQEAIVRALLVCGADMRAVSRANTSPEMWASSRGFFEIADLLKTAREHSTGAYSPKAFSASVPTISNSLAESSSISRVEEEPDEITLVRPRTNPVAVNRDSLSRPISEAGEYIRKVGPLGVVISAPIEFERKVDPVVPFSPFSALVDRLSTSWPQFAIVFLVVAIFSAAVTFTILKVVKRGPQSDQAQATAATSAPGLTQRTASPATQSVPLPTEQAKPSVNTSPQEKLLEQVSSRSSDHAVAANAQPQPSSEPSPASIRSANRSEEKGRMKGTVASYSNEGVKAARTKRRGGGVAAAPVSDGPTDVNSPAPPVVESKQQVPAARKATGEIPSLPLEPIKGSTTKRKVIQWP